MAIQFSEIPSNLRVPGNYLEVDPSLAERGAGAFPFRALLLGQKTAAGTLSPSTVERITPCVFFPYIIFSPNAPY